jgi:hypothetical protein
MTHKGLFETPSNVLATPLAINDMHKKLVSLTPTIAVT